MKCDIRPDTSSSSRMAVSKDRPAETEKQDGTVAMALSRQPKIVHYNIVMFQQPKNYCCTKV
uniref:Uncharacterized protein n=1 Tax=Parascaris univalens TaxID=6257 RepID=A0A914ZSD2_PARUN